MLVAYPIECQWPPMETTTLRSSDHLGAFVLVEWRDDARIYVRIQFKDGRVFDLYSPVIKRPMPALIKCAFRWNTENASMAVAGKIVDKTDEANVFKEKELEISEKNWTPDADLVGYLSGSAAMRRSNRMKSIADRASSKSGAKRLRTFEEDLSSLGDRWLSLRDLLRLVKDGKEYHLSGVSAALRLLICTGGQSPLLQRVAGHLNAELLIYGASPRAFEESKANGCLPNIADFTSSGLEEVPGHYLMDLDDWLSHTGFVFRGKKLTNNEALRLLADVDGVHSDPMVLPAFDFWHTNPSINGTGLRHGFLLQTGVMVLGLAHRLHGLGMENFSR